MPRNRLFTRSYLSKRLREAGFTIKRLPIEYSSSDSRYWSILVDLPDCSHNVILTCCRCSRSDPEATFKINSTKVTGMTVVTMSAEVMVSTLQEVMVEE